MSLWNQESDQTLTVLWAAGHSTAEIGRMMGVTKNSVIGRAHRLRLPPRRPSIFNPHITERAPLPAKAEPKVKAEAAPKPKPQPAPAPAPAPVIAQRPLTLSRACVWPMTAGKPWRFCNEPCSGTYCAEHQAISRAPGTALTERKISKLWRAAR